MNTLYTTVVWLVVAAHFAFLIYLPSGGFLALRWRRTIWLHVPVVLWGIGSVALHFWCPLTSLEQWARPRAGMPPLGSAGFIDHYITGVMYPSGATGYAQAAAFSAVLVSWIAYVATARRRDSPRPFGSPRQAGAAPTSGRTARNVAELSPAVGSPAHPADLDAGAGRRPA